MDGLDYDVVVIGSGFGGSVAALRLVEKGYRVAVLEAGRRFDDPSSEAPRERHRALPVNSWRTVSARRSLFGWSMRSRPGHGEPSPTWIPAAHRAVRMLATELGGMAGGTWLDLFSIPTTAHFIGGCAIGDSSLNGVIDPYQRIYGHEGLHVVDGSAVSANLGVNPSLTITAQAERAMSLWPNHGDPDPRPPLGTPYRRVVPIMPKNPAVPAGAPAALRGSAAQLELRFPDGSSSGGGIDV